jgi:tetratricopeptide (TPR) repeat protein
VNQRLVRACLVLALTLVSVGRARADDAPSAPSAPSAAALRRLGDEAMDARRAAEALDAYRRAAALEPGPALDYNIGRALLATGDFAGALASFEKFQREAPEDLKARTHLLGQIMAELEGKVATIEASGTPAGARVLVRGVEVGVLPLAVRVNAGVAEIRVTKEGYDPAIETRDLAPRASTRLEVALVPERSGGQLSIFAQPPNARVVIDGHPHGTSPVTLDLAAGAHELVIEAPSHRARRIPLDLAKGEIRRVDITLDREATPLTKSPWFWAGIGLLVAGAVVTTVALTQTRSPDDGSLGTFQVP